MTPTRVSVGWQHFEGVDDRLAGSRPANPTFQGNTVNRLCDKPLTFRELLSLRPTWFEVAARHLADIGNQQLRWPALLQIVAEPRGVPWKPHVLNAEAVIIRRQTGKHRTHVFSYLGNSVKQVNTKAWVAALTRAGIEDFRWHDLGHTLPGRAGMCRTAPRFMRYRNWAGGRVRRWCGAMRASRLSIWLRTRIDCVHFGWWIVTMAQLRHTRSMRRARQRLTH